jgi:hypothetical protein
VGRTRNLPLLQKGKWALLLGSRQLGFEGLLNFSLRCSATCRGLKITPGALSLWVRPWFRLQYSLPRSKASKLSKRKGSKPFKSSGRRRDTVHTPEARELPRPVFAQPSSRYSHPSLVKSTSIRSLAGAALCFSLLKTRQGLKEKLEKAQLRGTRFH